MQFRRTGTDRKGIPHFWVVVLCLVSFGIGLLSGGGIEYGEPIETPPISTDRSSSSSSGTIHDIARELVENTLGEEMTKQADNLPPDKVKAAFYKALSATVGKNAKAVLAQQIQSSVSSSSGAQSKERSFYEVARTTNTDKVLAHRTVEKCAKDDSQPGCLRKGCKNVRCIPWGHFYDTFYQSQLGHLSRDDTEPFQALEIGFYKGNGFMTYERWLPRAEMHSMEIACLPPGPISEGKWPHGNPAATNKTLYEGALAKGQLHCGDASNIDWVNKIWTTEMKRKDSPPLKLVIDDGSHIATHMATSLFYWFPRIEPGGYMVVEDIQPIDIANRFRTQLMPQIMADLHYCGEPRFPDEGPCFPTIQPLLQSIYCEMHICVFRRNEQPAQELSLEESKMPSNALDASKCPSLPLQKWDNH